MKIIKPSPEFRELIVQIAKEALQKEPELEIWPIPDSPSSGLISFGKTDANGGTRRRVIRVENNEVVGEYEMETRAGWLP